MITLLKVKNFALISDVEINFNKGFSVITGETGSGKSIILDALGFLLGRRAESSFIGVYDKKCIIEAKFNLVSYNFKSLFENYDWDYEDETIIRREISTNGKSRAFINDSPVLLNDLKIFGEQLVDIHGQHSFNLLNSNHFYYSILDGISNSMNDFKLYQKEYKLFDNLKKEIQFLDKEIQSKKNEEEFKQFKIKELAKLNLVFDEQSELESEFENLNHAEEIKSALNKVSEQILYADSSVTEQLISCSDTLKKVASINPKYQEILDRLISASIELKDIAEESETISLKISSDNERLQWIDDRLGILFGAIKKFAVTDANELINIYNNLKNEIEGNNKIEEELESKKNELNSVTIKLSELAENLNKKRKEGSKKLTKSVLQELSGLNMINSNLEVQFTKSDFTAFGNQNIEFLFNANKGGKLEKIVKIASGGEMSRLMLVFKKILSQYVPLPTIIFDEIDTGVSGDVAGKMAEMMVEMSKSMQLISISHLPQIAGKSTFHYKVWKNHEKDQTTSHIQLLNQEERINELAKMLSGSSVTPAAIQNAKEILQISN